MHRTEGGKGLARERFETRVVVPDIETAGRLYGDLDQNLRLIREAFPVEIVTQGNEIWLAGEPGERAKVASLLEGLLARLSREETLGEQEIRYAIEAARQGDTTGLSELGQDVVAVTNRGRAIVAKTLGQVEYLKALRQNDYVFVIGPAGTGKTYLAVAMAVSLLKERRVSRLILTRPAVEAGEKLGFLPGDLQEKVDPYLRPLFDALFDILGADTFEKYRERGLVEIAPLAYMRGRTLDDSFVILDEAQNSTSEQMKMLLTRLGFGSRAVITGDITQVDLPRSQASGLIEARQILQGIEGIAFVTLTDRDVVRHPLVQKIILAYQAHEQGKG